MNAINNFNVLPFYTSLAKQNGKKWYAFGNIYPLASPRDKILPFQIVMTSTVASVSALTIHNYKTGAIIASGLTPTIYTPEGQSYSIIYLKLSTISQLAEGRYYLTITVDGTTLYSEIFNAISDLSEYVKIEYWNEDDLYTKDKIQVYFGDDFKFVMYACTDIGKPEYLFEEELTKRLGYKFLESQVSNKVYKFTFLAPEYLTDSMRIIRLSDYIKLTQGDEEFNALAFAYDAKWEQQGDLASVECEFETDTIIQKLQSFNRRQLESFYNALLSNIDEPILFDTEVVAQYYADFQTGGLIQGKLIHELELETELKEGAFIPIDNNDSTPAKRISVSLLTASSHTHTNKVLLDLITQSAIDVLSHLSVVDSKVKVDVDFWSTGEISAYGSGATGGVTGSSSLGGLVNVGAWADELPVSDRIMVQLAGATHWSSKLLSEVVGLDTIALGAYLTTNNYVTKTYVDDQINTKTHTHENKSTLDLITQNHLDLLSHLSLVEGRIKVDVDFWSTGEISAYGSGATGGGASGSLGELVNVGLWANEVPTSSRIMVQVAGETHWSSKLLSEVTGLDTAALGSYLTTNGYSKQSYVDTRIAELVASSPTTLDTLNELAAALGNDPNFATSMTTLIGTKWTQDNTKIANWDSAFGASHTHANKSVLDGVTSELITNWNTAFTNNHTHSNKAVIDSITQANLDVLARLSVVDGNLKVDTNFWSTGEVSAYGAGVGTGGGSGLISSVYGSAGLGGSYSNSDLTNTFNAYTINLINNNLTSALGRIGALETSTPNVAWGVATSQYSPLTINSVTRNLSVDGHTHSYLPLSGGVLSNSVTNIISLYNNTGTDVSIGYQTNYISKYLGFNNGVLKIADTTDLSSGNTVWHAGNDGAGSGLDADLFNGLNYSDFGRYFVAAGFNSVLIPDGVYGGKLFGAYNFPYPYYSFLSVGNGYYKMQFNGYNNTLYYRAGSESGLSDKPWRLVAFEDSNVASATKLANTRYIWGNAFTGEGDVTGRITFSNYDTHIAMPIGYIGCNTGDSYFWNTSNHPIKFGTNDLERMRIAPTGNVLIGTSTDAGYKLDVNGTIRAIGIAYFGNNLRIQDSGSYSELIGGAGKSIKFYTNDGIHNPLTLLSSGNVCVNTSADYGYKVDVNGTFRVVGASYINNTLTVDGLSTLKGISVTNGSYSKAISMGGNSHLQMDGVVASYTYNLPATIGWYRVAVSAVGVERPFGQFDISWTLSSYHGSLSLTAGTMYASAPFITQTAYSNFGTCITKSRIVYNTSYSGTYAYLEVYNETGKAVSLTVRGYNLTGWNLYSASKVGSIPSGYSNKEISHISGYTTSGNVAALGEITAYSASDRRLKENIRPLTNSLSIIESMNPVSYNWNNIAKELNPLKSNNRDFGLVAQELELIVPELVHTIYGGQYKSIDYVKIIPHLICAIKQLKSEIDMLKS